MGLRPALTSLLTNLPKELSLLAANREMRRIAEELTLGCPIGYEVKGHAGQGGRTTTPWIGVSDPTNSDGPTNGLYAAYIRHPDSKAVSLTLQQGSDDLRERVGATAAKDLLRQRADWVRSALNLGPDSLAPRSFGSGKRQPLYEAGSIGSITYTDDLVPTEDVLRDHLESILQVLDDAADALRSVKGSQWTVIDTPSVQDLIKVDPKPIFTPKRSDNYRVEIAASSQVKTRLHENVVNNLQAQQAASGWQATSEHPIDLVLRRSAADVERIYIVEVKQVRKHNIIEAVRGAVGQLFWYRYKQFPEEQRRHVQLVAAFSEDVGFDARQLLSEELGIAVLWLDERQWHGCRRAKYEDLVPERA